jgi:hypothetical protein
VFAAGLVLLVQEREIALVELLEPLDPIDVIESFGARPAGKVNAKYARIVPRSGALDFCRLAFVPLDPLTDFFVIGGGVAFGRQLVLPPVRRRPLGGRDYRVTPAERRAFASLTALLDALLGAVLRTALSAMVQPHDLVMVLFARTHDMARLHRGGFTWWGDL